MGNIFEKYNIKVLGEKDFVPKLTLDDAPKVKAQPQPQSEYDQFLASDGVLPSIVRGLATTGNRTLSYLNAGADALGLDPVISPNRIDRNLNSLEQIKERNSQEGITPTRKREIDAIKSEVEKAQGWDAAAPILKQFGDTLIHPKEWTVQGAVENFSPSDPLNLAGFGLGSVAAKPIKSTIGKIIAGGLGGSAEGAVIGGGGEYASAIGRGKSHEEAKKMAIGGAIGGAATGGVIGSAVGGFTKPHAAVIDPNAPIKEAMDNGIDMNGNPREARMGADGTYRAFDYPANPDDIIPGGSGTAFDIGYKRENPTMIADKGIDYTDTDGAAQGVLGYEDRAQLPYQEQKLITHNGTIIAGNQGWSEPLGNRIQEALDTKNGNDINDRINGIIDVEVSDKVATHVTQWADSREMIMREESSQAQAQITQMIGSGMDRQTISTALDNMITPSREDMTITGLLNNNTPLPSRLSGVRPIMLLENSIKTAVENPAIARTNKEFYDVLVAQGVDKPYANIMTSAYAAKDPQILRDHIYQTLAKNAETLVEHEPIRQEAQVKAAEVVSANEGEAKINALMPQLEFHPSKEKDNSIFFNYDGHEYFVNAHGAMGKVGIGEDGRRRYFAEDFDQRIGLTYGERTKLAERVYALKGKEVDNTAIITQADRDANSQRVFVDYLTKGQAFKDENIDLPRAFQDFWKPTKPQSIDEFKKYVSKNKEKYTIQTLLNDSKSIAKDMQNISNDSEKISVVDGWKFVGARGIGNTDHPSQFATYAAVRDINGVEKMLPIAEFERGDLTNLQDIAERVPFPKVKKARAMPVQAQRIKDASDIIIGGSEDEAKRASQQGFKKQMDSEYKKMNAKTRAELEQNYANQPEDLYGKALANTNEVHGNDVGSANMALIEGRAKAMGITADEFMKQNNLTVENLTKEDGAQHIKDLQEGDAAFQLSENVINGMVEMGFKSTGEMRNTIKLFSTADVSTLPHELMHVFERTLDKEERAAFDHAFREYAAGEDRSEAGARGFEAYLGEGKAPTKELQAVFDKFKNWLRDLWEMVFHAPENGFKLNDSQRAFYRAMMGDKEAIKEVFGEIDAAPIQKDMIAAKILDDMPEHTTVTKGENTQGGLFGADDGIIEQPKLFSDKVEVDTLKVPDTIKATPQEYRTTIREMAKGESLTHPMIAEQIKRSKSYIEAKEDAIIKGKGESLFGDDPKPETVLEDVGEKIGGARKDDWANRGITVKDLEAMSGGEAAKYATKDNVLGKADYAKMVEEGADARRVALYKIIRDRMAAKPGKDTPKDRADYVEMMGVVREVLGEYMNDTITSDKIDARAMEKIGMSMGKFANGTMEQKNKFWSIYKGRSSPLHVGYKEKIQIDSMISKGFPTIEPYRKVYTAIVVGKNDAGELEYGLRTTNGYVYNGERVITRFATKDEALAHAKKLYDERKTAGDKTLTDPKRPHLDKIERTGEDVRSGKDTGADDFMRQYGFRGVEFGNWAAKDERQKILNHAYDGLNDLARVLNIPDKAVSLNGTLGMAFGSRGKGSAAAHYEPSKIVINMTKLSGAGSMAHEWGHALDHYFGELDRDNAYDGAGKYTTGGRGTHVDRSNLRTPMKEAFANVMEAMFKGESNRAEVIRKYELDLEAAQAIQSSGKSKPGSFSRVSWLQKRLNDLLNGDNIQGAESSYYTNAKQLNGKSGEYWTRPTEMFARAFEAYVFDKLNTDFKRSDYLVQGVEGERYATGFKGNPYPVGMERQNISLAFDALFKTIKQESMNDGNIRLFQTQKVADGLKKMMEDC